MQLFDSNGYLDSRSIRDAGYPFTFIIGGRGTGKTYGALRTSIEDERIFAFMRRRQTQADMISKPEFSPLRPVCADTGWTITTRPIVRGISGFYQYHTEDNKTILEGEPLGYILALSTLANVRGFDGSRIQLLLYDEFLPERGERCLPSEADTLLNAYETINRNRELAGEPALQLLALANANDLGASILVQLGLIRQLDRMSTKGRQIWTDDQRGIMLILLRDSPISAAKADTALYRLTDGSDFAGMALANAVAYEDRSGVGSRPLGEYKPLVSIGDLTIYAHKSRREYYATRHRSGGGREYGTTELQRTKFRKDYGWLYRELMCDRVISEDYPSKVLLRQYLTNIT